MKTRVVVSIVTYNSAAYLEACLKSLKAQTYADSAVCLWDNASTDHTAKIASEYASLLGVCHLAIKNLGFCAAHNRIIASTSSDYVLVLNPDVILDPCFIDILVNAMDNDASAGSATGKLVRWNLAAEKGPAATVPCTRILDSAGIYFTPNQRHLDRGSGDPDTGRYEKLEYVFGASGAAAFYRRTMLEDVQAGNEYFDEAFFAFREDADLAWRAQWRGWRCLYVPEAVGFHARQVLPQRRRMLPREINMHSFKNRFLMRVKNMDAATYIRFFLPITVRDLGALAYVLLRERSSLRALPLFFQTLPKALSLRRAIRKRRRASPEEVRAWFSKRPVSRPAPAGLTCRDGP